MEEQNSTPAESTQEQTPLESENNSQPAQEQTPESAEQEPAKSGQETAELESQEQEPQTTEKVIDWEKRAKDTQASFTKVSQELAELKKQVEQSKPRLVQEGKINPEFEQKYKMQVDNMEFLAYDNLARQLEPETRAVVENLLNDARRLYNPSNKSAYDAKLNQIKDYFRSDLVIGIENNKQNELGKIKAKFDEEIQKDWQQKAERAASAIKAVPELKSLLCQDGENFSPEVFGIVDTIFRYTGDVDIEATTSAISKIKELGVKEYLAKQNVQKAANNANVPEGETVIQKSSMPTAEEIRTTPGLYTKLAKKHGQAKIDAILMKG